jgi:Pyridoxamine 5'-phosphate oxidase
MRSASQRKADALLRLERDANVWIATSSADGQPHLVPLSLAWDGLHMLVATPSVTPTARNAAATGVCKASLDSADDVVIIDADVEVVDFASSDPETVARYVERVGWNPADAVSGTFARCEQVSGRRLRCRRRRIRKCVLGWHFQVYADPAGHPCCLCFLVGDARYPDGAT